MKLSLCYKLVGIALCLQFVLCRAATAGGVGGGRPSFAYNSFKSGISYSWLSDYDVQGVMFSNRYSYLLTERFAVGGNIGLLTASHYDNIEQIYTVRNSYYMATLNASYDFIYNKSLSFRVGVGPAARYRAEVVSKVDGQGTGDGTAEHIRASDVGGNIYLENDFFVLRYGVAGSRLEYFYYTDGTPVIAIGLHIGFMF